MLTPHTVSSLEQQQRGLLAILRGQPAPDERDPWLKTVASSPGLGMIQTIALWWQRFQIEWQCRYTSRLMKRLGCFDSYIAEHFREHPTPPSIEAMSAQFLNSLHSHSDPLLRAVATLELACIQPKRARTVTIHWDRNPNQVMDALDRFAELPEPEPKVRYILRMGAEQPDGVSCVREVLRA